MATYTSSSTKGIGTPGIDNLYSESLYTLRITSNNPTTSSTSGYMVWDGQGENVVQAGGEINLPSINPTPGTIPSSSGYFGQVAKGTAVQYAPFPMQVTEIGETELQIYQTPGVPPTFGSQNVGGDPTGIGLLLKSQNNRGAIAVTSILIIVVGAATGSDFYNGAQILLLPEDIINAGGIGEPAGEIVPTLLTSSFGAVSNLIFTPAVPGVSPIAGLPASGENQAITGSVGFRTPPQTLPTDGAIKKSIIVDKGLDFKMGVFVSNTGSIDTTYQFTPTETIRSQSYAIRTVGDLDVTIDGPILPGEGSGSNNLENLYSCGFRGEYLGTNSGSYCMISAESSSIYRHETLKDMTLSAWVRPMNLQNYIDYVNCAGDNIGAGSQFNYQFRLGYLSGKVHFGHEYGNRSSAFASRDWPNIGLGRYTHLAFSRTILANGSGKYEIYVDGVKGADFNFSSVQTPTGGESSSLTMGRGRFTTGYNFASASIDEVSIFNTTKSAVEINEIYNSGSPTNVSLLPGIVSWWRMGDSAGEDVYPIFKDYGKARNDITMYNLDANDINGIVPDPSSSF